MQSAEGAASGSRLEAGTSRLDQTCRQVAKARGEHVDRLVWEQRTQRATMRGMNSAQRARVVDWIIRQVDWMECTEKNQSTGSWQKVQRINPSRRQNRGTQISVAVRL